MFVIDAVGSGIVIPTGRTDFSCDAGATIDDDGLITDGQMEELIFVLDELCSKKVDDDKLIAGIAALVSVSLESLEVESLSILTNAQAAKIIGSYSRKLDELSAKKGK